MYIQRRGRRCPEGADFTGQAHEATEIRDPRLCKYIYIYIYFEFLSIKFIALKKYFHEYRIMLFKKIKSKSKDLNYLSLLIIYLYSISIKKYFFSGASMFGPVDP